MSNHVTIFEVAPRDGLQNESAKIRASEKIALVNQLSNAGCSKIEVTAFVSPKWVPQMKDAPKVMAGIERKPGVTYAALTPNKMGYQFARKARADEVAVFAAASETFSQKNINCGINTSIQRFMPVIALAKQDGIAVRGYISCVVTCPYEGAIAPRAVADLTKTLLDIGCYQVSLGDTIGAGNTATIAAMLDAVLAVASPPQLAGHYHDTGNRALANIEVSLAKGLRTFDSAIGGLGGCPYAPGAKGNVSTRSVVEMLHNNGYQTGIDQAALVAIENYVAGLLAQDVDKHHHH